jgi:hypothetical protein
MAKLSVRQIGMASALEGSMFRGRTPLFFVVCLFIASFVGVTPATATPIGWKFTGLLGQAGASVLSLPANSPFEWVVHLDYSAANSCDPSTDQGSYTGIGSGSLRVGGEQWTAGPGSVEVNTIQGACPGPSPAGVTFRQFAWTSSTGFPMFPLALVGSLDYPTRTDGSIPAVPPTGALVTWNGLGSFNSFDVWTTVGEETTPVPEPATLTLLGSGVAVAWWRRRRPTRESDPRRSA